MQANLPVNILFNKRPRQFVKIFIHFARELVSSLVNQPWNCVKNSWLVFSRRDKD